MGKKRTAVLLFNLGGPDSLGSVKKFLFNMFNDKYILTLPQPLRFLIASIISSSRYKTSCEIYKKMGGKSPILEETKLQAQQLERKLSYQDEDYKVFIAMKHWHPFFDTTIKEIKHYNPDKVILLPLYPHYSTTTTLSFLSSCLKSIPFPTKIHCCYYNNNKYIKAWTEQIIPFYEKASQIGKPKLIFSAHSLPVKVIKNGDPYQWHIEKSVELITNNLKNIFSDIEWQICYQSKIGPVEWLKPSTEEVIKLASKSSRPIIIIPISFVSENAETLVELDIEYKNLIDEKQFFRVPTLSTNDTFISALEDIIVKKEQKSCCPNKHKKCWHRILRNSARI